jgi:hypothetical protein
MAVIRDGSEIGEKWGKEMSEDHAGLGRDRARLDGIRRKGSCGAG